MPQPFAITDRAAFIQEHTELHEPPLVPEVRLYLADEDAPIWRFTEEQLAERGLPPPFWAFAWAGGQALSRYILDNPEIVAGQSVLDFGSGSGLIAIAAMKAGARAALAADIDLFACAACDLNAPANNVRVASTAQNLVGVLDQDWGTVLVGDMCYEQPLAGDVETWLRALSARGTNIYIGDPGRTYLPKDRLEKITSYAVKTQRDLEDTDVRSTSVWRLI